MNLSRSAGYQRKRYIAIFLLPLLVIIVSIFHREIYRLYKVVWLFDRHQIAQNFLSMSEIFPSRLIENQTKYSNSRIQLNTSLLTLPESFVFEGAVWNIEQYLLQTSTTGFIVIHQGKLVSEKYYQGLTRQGLHISWSINKSFVSALIGIAVDQGKIRSIDEPVESYAPQLIGSGYEGVSIKNVLKMSSGVAFNEDYGDFYSDINRMGRVIALGNSINQFAASLTREVTPGSLNRYVSMDTQVLGMVVMGATGQSLAHYLSEQLWKPLEMESSAKWLVDDQGMELAFGTINATLRDYARFGQLYLNKGRWNGKLLINEDWINQSVASADFIGDTNGSAFGYGYQWWLPPGNLNDFMARGVYGQYIYVSPEHSLVIVKLSADPDWLTRRAELLKTTRMFQSIAQQLATQSPSTLDTQTTGTK